MTLRNRRRWVPTIAGALCLTVFAHRPGAGASPEQSRFPKLVVLMMVDQMRADYVDRFKADWTGGLKRLVTRGAWFRRAAYPYLTTVTCAGHATVSTGTFPHKHGVFNNAWWDRETRRLVTCTEDGSVHDIGYTSSPTAGNSGVRLEVPSLGDRLRAERGAHVVSVSLKARSAIMLAGHGGDAVTWLTDSLDSWATSSMYASAPVGQVKMFVDQNPIDRDYGKTWTLLLPEPRYREPDDGVGESAPRGWTATFPHRLAGSNGKPDAQFYQEWESSPYGDEYLGRFAAALAESMALGQHDGTDMLAVSFSSPDIVGHGFGPRSREIQDMYARLDRTIGALLDRLDTLVGPNEYVVGLTADHGVTPLPEQLRKAGKDAGRLTVAAIVDPVETRARAVAGAGKYIARLAGNDMYFEPGMFEKLAATPGALDQVLDTIKATPGIARVFRGDMLGESVGSADLLLRAAALSYVPGRSGDLVIALKPGWMFGNAGTTHGSADPDDQRVPILLMGRGVKPGQYLQAATPADVAPTLAALAGTTMPGAEGHVLTTKLTKITKGTGGAKE